MASPPTQFKRVAEHFAVVGVTAPPSLLNDSSSSPHTLRESWLNAIVDVAVVFPSKGEYVPLGYEMLKSTPSDAKADLNTDCLGVGQGPMFLCIRRRRNLPKQSQAWHPHISDIAIVRKSAFEMKLVDVLAPLTDKSNPLTPGDDTFPVKTGWKLIETSVSGRPADLNHNRLFGALGPNNEKSIYLAVKLERVKSRHSSNSTASRSNSNASSSPDRADVRFHVPPAVISICVCVAGERPPHGYELLPRNINANAVGGSQEVRIGKKSSGPLGLCDQLWVAQTLDSLPKGPSMFTPSFALPKAELPSFIFPSGGARMLHRKGRNAPLPSRFEFLFTGVNGDKMFASALLFHERVEQQDVDKLLMKFSGVWCPVDDDSDEDGDAEEEVDRSSKSFSPVNTTVHSRPRTSTSMSAAATGRLSFSDIKQSKLIELLALCNSLKENIVVKDRPYHLKMYQSCFLGSEAVSYVAKAFASDSRAKAIEKLDDAIRAGMISHVTNEHMMEDGYLFYKFLGDAKPSSGVSALNADPFYNPPKVENKDQSADVPQSWKTWFSPSKAKPSAPPPVSPSSPPSPPVVPKLLTKTRAKASSSSSTSKAEDRLYAPKVIVILSSHPFYRAMSVFLTQLYALSLSPSPAPLERHISTFLSHMPIPPKHDRNYHVHLDLLLNEETTGLPTFKSTLAPIVIPPLPVPGSTPPQIDLDFLSIFRALSVPNVIKVFTVLLREGRVLILSSCGALLTETCEILRSILFPLDWQCCYVPRLPEGLVGALEAPGGYLIGVLTGEATSDMPLSHIPIGGLTTSLSSLVRRQLAEGVCVVSLDHDVVVMGEVNDDLIQDLVNSGTTPSADDRESFLGEENLNLPNPQPPQPPTTSVAMSTPSSAPLSPAIPKLTLAFDQVVFNDPGPQPPKRPVAKLRNRLETLRVEAKRALNLVALPLTPTDRTNYASAYNFAPVPAFVDEGEGSGSDEDGDGEGLGLEGEGVRKKDTMQELSAGVRDAFIRFMCHPLVLGSYAAYIENSEESDAKEIEEYRNVVMVQNLGEHGSQPTSVPNSSPGDSVFLERVEDDDKKPKATKPHVEDRGFYDVFDEPGFIKCGSGGRGREGRDLRGALVKTQMFVVLVEERWGINLRRRSLTSSATFTSRFAGRESALFFERCCMECKKKAEKKLQNNALLKYPAERGGGAPNVKSERRIEVQVSETLRMESRKQNSLQQQSLPLPQQLVKETSTGSNISSGSGSNSNSCTKESQSPAVKSLKVVAGAGAGFGFGLIFGPLGAMIGAVMGTGMSAGAVSRGEPFFKPNRARKRRRNKHRSSSATSQKFPQPTILTRAQIFAAFGKNDAQRRGNPELRTKRPLHLPGATTVDLDGKLWAYDRWPSLKEELVLVPDHAIPPLLKKLQKMSLESDLSGEMLNPTSPRPSSVSGMSIPPPASLFRSETAGGVTSWETDALTSSSYVYSLYFLTLPSRLNSRQNALGQVREILACLGLLKKLQGVGQGMSHPHSLTGGLTSLLSSESVWRTILVSVGSVQSNIHGTLSKYKTEFMKSKKKEGIDVLVSRTKVMGTLSEGVAAGKRIGLELFKGMKQAGVAASQITLAHYLQSASNAFDLNSLYGFTGNSRSWRNAIGTRQLSGLSHDSDNPGEESLILSMEVPAEAVRGSSFSGAVVLHNTGLATPESLLPNHHPIMFEASTLPTLVSLGVKWIRDGCGVGLADSLMEAAGVAAGIERCEFENSFEGYFRDNIEEGGDGDGKGEGHTFEVLKEPASPKRFDTPPVPPGTPVGRKSTARTLFAEDAADGTEAEEVDKGTGSSVDEANTFAEERSFATQYMWNYKPCEFCKVPPLDEEILAAWAEQGKAVDRVRREIEKIRRVGGLRRGRRASNTGQSGHGSNDDVIAAAKAALLSVQEAPSGDKLGAESRISDNEVTGGSSDALDSVCLEISCGNCGKPYQPTLFFESFCPVAGDEEFVTVENSKGSVPYLSPEVMHNLWEAVTNLHGRVAGGSPEWLVLNKPLLYHNFLWWTSRRLDIPKHVHFPLVGVGWKKSVAKHKVTYEVERGGEMTRVPAGLKLSKSVSSEGSGSGRGLRMGMEMKDIFAEDGIDCESSVGAEFLRLMEQALGLLRKSAGLRETLEIIAQAVIVASASGQGWGSGAREKKKFVYASIIQLCAHFEITSLNAISNLHLLNLLPKLESQLAEDDEGWEDVWVGGRGCAMRSVFGHLY